MPDDVETTARGAAMLAAAGAGLHSSVAAAGQAMACPRGEPVQPDPELREVYDDAAPAAPGLYAALRPLFNGVARTHGGWVGVGSEPPRATSVTSMGHQPIEVTLVAAAAVDPLPYPAALTFGGHERRARPAARHGHRRAHRGDLDVLVIGGGITGAGAALDAATRGLRVGLVEARDLAAGTSSASSKLIHGGLRYLEMGDIGLVREALRERELLLTRTAPHLVEPVPFLWPLHGRGWERAYLGAGLLLYDTIGGARSVPRHRHLSKRRALAEAPALRPDALVGAVQFHDALEDDAHMVAVVARTAAAHGAHIATRVRVTGFGGPGEVEAIDEESGEPLLLRARHVAGAAGAWTDELRALAGGRSACRNVHSKGIHVFVARDRIPMETGVLARTEKSVLFVDPVAGRLADRRHRHAVGARPRPAGRDRRRRRLPARQDQRAARRAADARRRPRRHRGPAAARRRGRPQRHHPHQPQARRRVARARPDHDRGRQVHDLPGDGRRPDRRGGGRAGRRGAVGDPRRAAARRPRRARGAVADRPELAEPLEGGGARTRGGRPRLHATRARSTSRTCSSAAPASPSPPPTGASRPPRPPPR